MVAEKVVEATEAVAVILVEVEMANNLTTQNKEISRD